MTQTVVFIIVAAAFLAYVHYRKGTAVHNPPIVEDDQLSVDEWFDLVVTYINGIYPNIDTGELKNYVVLYLANLKTTFPPNTSADFEYTDVTAREWSKQIIHYSKRIFEIKNSE